MKKASWGSGFHMDSRLFRELEYYQIQPLQLLDWANNSNDITAFVNKLISYSLRESGKDFFLEKTPSNVYCFHDFIGRFPEGKVIHVIRDGRDVFCSLLKRGFPAFVAGSRWLYDVTCGLSAREQSNYLEVKYEDLVTNPEFVLEDICKFIGVDFEGDILHADVNEQTERIYLDSWQSRPNQAINSNSVGKYKLELNHSQIKYLFSLRLGKRSAKELGMSVHSPASLLNILGYKECSAEQSTDFKLMALNFIRYEQQRKKRLRNFSKSYYPPLTRFYFMPELF